VTDTLELVGAATILNGTGAECVYSQMAAVFPTSIPVGAPVTIYLSGAGMGRTSWVTLSNGGGTVNAQNITGLSDSVSRALVEVPTTMHGALDLQAGTLGGVHVLPAFRHRGRGHRHGRYQLRWRSDEPLFG